MNKILMELIQDNRLQTDQEQEIQGLWHHRGHTERVKEVKMILLNKD
jgi:hypothetical protein